METSCEWTTAPRGHDCVARRGRISGSNRFETPFSHILSTAGGNEIFHQILGAKEPRDKTADISDTQSKVIGTSSWVTVEHNMQLLGSRRSFGLLLWTVGVMLTTSVGFVSGDPSNVQVLRQRLPADTVSNATTAQENHMPLEVLDDHELSISGPAALTYFSPVQINHRPGEIDSHGSFEVQSASVESFKVMDSDESYSLSGVNKQTGSEPSTPLEDKETGILSFIGRVASRPTHVLPFLVLIFAITMASAYVVMKARRIDHIERENKRTRTRQRVSGLSDGRNTGLGGADVLLVEQLFMNARSRLSLAAGTLIEHTGSLVETIQANLGDSGQMVDELRATVARLAEQCRNLGSVQFDSCDIRQKAEFVILSVGNAEEQIDDLVRCARTMGTMQSTWPSPAGRKAKKRLGQLHMSCKQSIGQITGALATMADLYAACSNVQHPAITII